MKTFQKLISLALAAMMICSCMVFTTLAADAPAAQATEGETIIPITTCETKDGFSTGSSGVVDTTDPWAGNASLATTISGVAGKAKIMYQYKNESMTFDATAMKTLVFDVYVSSVDAFKDTVWKIELRGKGDGDAKQRVIQKTLPELLGTEFVDGWNHIELPIDNMEKKGSPNMHLWNYFRIFNNGGTAGIDGETNVIKLDNIYLTSREAGKPGVVNLLHSFAIDGFKGADGPKVQQKKLDAPLDISKMDAIQFNVRISDKQVNDIKFSIRMSSNTNINSNRFQSGEGRTLKELAGYEIPADGQWHTVLIPFSTFFHANNNTKMDMNKLQFFQLYNVKTNADMTTPCKIEFSNICFVQDQTEGDVLIWSAKDNKTELGSTVSLRDGDANKAEGYKHSFGDVDGDGVNEWVLLDVDGNGTINNNGGWDSATGSASKPGLKSAVQFSVDKAYGFGNMTALKFDLYLENEAWLSQRLNIELSSSGKTGNSAILTNKTMQELFGDNLKVGWNTVVLPLEKLETAKPGNTGAFSLRDINYIQIYSRSTFDFTGGIAMAIRNISAVRENQKVAATPDVEGAFDYVNIDSAKLNLQDAFNIIYTASVHKSTVGAFMVFEITDANGNVTTKQVKGQAGEKDDTLTFTYENIYPQSMTDNISTTLWAVNHEGKLVSDKVSEYSIKQYCVNLLNGIADGTVKDEDGTLATLLSNALVFGAALQNHIGYNTENLATDGVDLSAASFYTPPTHFSGIQGDKGDCPATFDTAWATIENIYYLYVAFEAEDVSGLKMNVVSSTGTQTLTIDTFDTVTLMDNDNIPYEAYVVEIPVRVYEMNTAYTITFEGYEDYKLTYSLGTYLSAERARIANEIKAATDAEQITELTNYKTLLESMIVYGTSAYKYAVNH